MLIEDYFILICYLFIIYPFIIYPLILELLVRIYKNQLFQSSISDISTDQLPAISVLIAAYNEVDTLEETIETIYKQQYPKMQVHVGSDGSNDGTESFLKNNKNLFDNLVRSENNEGKGSAIKKALLHSDGDVIIIQDSDLEYDPNDYDKILQPFILSNADVVYGNRFGNNKFERIHYFSHRIANFALTTLVNFFTNINFSDVECGFKAFKTSVLKNISLFEKSFGFEIEVTKKISKLNLKIFQVPVSYNGRSYSEGKKIKFIDALRALYCVVRY